MKFGCLVNEKIFVKFFYTTLIDGLIIVIYLLHANSIKILISYQYI